MRRPLEAPGPHWADREHRNSALTVDEPDNRIEPGSEALSGVDLDPRGLHRNPLEGIAPSHEFRPIAIRPRTHMYPASRVVFAAMQSAPEGDVGGNHAMHDAEMR